jgi:hypothetical protein
MEYCVIVGNCGTVLTTTNKMKAEKSFKAYMYDSEDGIGRVGGEEVTLMGDGEIIRSFIPEDKKCE